MKEIEKKNEEPFYERLRREDKERLTKKLKGDKLAIERMSHSAAYKNGKCMIDLKKHEDYAEID